MRTEGARRKGRAMHKDRTMRTACAMSRAGVAVLAGGVAVLVAGVAGLAAGLVTDGYAAVEGTAQGQALRPPVLATPFAATAGRVMHMAAAGDVAWVLQDAGLTAVDLGAEPPASFGAPLAFTPAVADQPPVYRGVAAAPSGLVLVVVDETLHVLDGSNPRSPVSLTTLVPADRIDRVLLDGSVAYLLVVGPGDDPPAVVDVMVVDLADPRAPRIARERILPAGTDAASDIVLAGDVLALVTPASLLRGAPMNVVRLFDRSDPLAPRFVAHLEDPTMARVVGGLREGRPTLVGSDGSGLVVFDVSDPGEPREVMRLDETFLPSDAGRRHGEPLMTDDGLIYVTAQQQLASFYTGGQLLRVGEAGGGSWRYTAAKPFIGPAATAGRRLLLPETASLSVHDPVSGTLGRWPTLVETAWVAAMAAPGGGPAHVLATTPVGGLFDLALDRPAALAPRTAYVDWTYRGRVSADDGWVVATNFGATDLHHRALDVFTTGAGGLALRGRIDLRNAGGGGGDVFFFAHQGRWLVTPDAFGSLGLFDLAAADGPSLRSTAPIELSGGGVAMDTSTVAWVGYEPGGVRTGETSALRLQAYGVAGDAPSERRLVPRGNVVVEPRAIVAWERPAVAVEGDHAHVLVQVGCVDAQRTELHVVDLSDLDAPRRVAVLPLPITARRPIVERGILLLAGTEVLAVDVRRPAAPRVLGALQGPSASYEAVDAAEGIVYAAGLRGYDGVFAFEPELPWRGAPGVPTPTPPPSPTAGPSPTPTTPPICPPTPTPTPRVSSVPPPVMATRTATATAATATATATSAGDPGQSRRVGYLPWTGR